MKALNEIPINVRAVGITMTLAALVIALVVAAINVNSAQAQGLGPIDGPVVPRTGDNAEEYDDPLPCSEEAQPDDAAKVIREGYYAVFDAFWDYEVGHLSDNFCPPEVTVTEESTGRGGTKIVTTRSDANIHISETAFSIPDSYKVTVVDSEATNGNPATTTEPKIDLADYPFLRDAVSAVKTENGATVFADNKVWWVRLDEPGTTTTDETSSLKIGFSTDLMEEADWYNPNGAPVQFQFSAVHVLEAGTPQEVHVVGADFFAFEQRATDTPLRKAKWSNLDTAAESEINMATGQYKPMQFIFTKPGEYLVQGQIQGHVRQLTDRLPSAPDDWTPISPGESLTSPTEWYTFHVGPVADVGLTLTHTDETPNDDATTVTDGTASFSVTATNNGPSTSNGVVVEVNLPVGLVYQANSARIGSATTAPASSVLSYACGVLSWRAGDLSSGQSFTLNFDAHVGGGVPKSLTVDAEVHSSTVDENEENDTASAEALLSSMVVRPPFFPGATRDIVEHAIAGSHAGDPVAANNPDGRALTYSLSGRCNTWFQVHPNGQIVLAPGHTLDYDKQSEFHLTLSVSDGVDASGAADTADDTEPVTINVIDTPDEAKHPTVTFSTNPEDPYATQFVQINATVSGLGPEDGGLTSCTWGDTKGIITGSTCHTLRESEFSVTRTFTVHLEWQNGGITASTTVTWR